MLDSPLKLLCSDEYLAKASIDLRLSTVQTASFDYIVLMGEDMILAVY